MCKHVLVQNINKNTNFNKTTKVSTQKLQQDTKEVIKTQQGSWNAPKTHVLQYWLKTIKNFKLMDQCDSIPKNGYKEWV